jgi:hypothetical protein
MPSRTSTFRSAADVRTRWAGLRYRYEIVALLGLLLATRLLHPVAPGGILLLGGVAGAGVLIQAIAVILVYRTGRFINIAQVQLGMAGALLFTGITELTERVLDAADGWTAEPPPVADVLAAEDWARDRARGLAQRSGVIRR